MTYEEASSVLEKNGQLQLLRFYDELDDNSKHNLLKQIEEIDFGIIDMIGKDDLFKKGIISPIKAMKIDEIEKNKDRYRQVGIDAIRRGKVGAVLLAGGQGTRLGFDKPKGMFNIGETREYYIFQALIDNLMEVVNEAESFIPLFIMTSEKNNDDTVKFFKDNNYFGYDKDFVMFFIQDMSPSADFNGKILLEDKGRVSTSPNGNGGWFTSMKRCGIVDRIHEYGVEWLNVFAVDNVLQRICDPSFIGATIESGYVSASKVVKKADRDEKVGVLCLEDNKPSIVEYYELTQQMLDELDESGERAYNYGVILNYLFRVSDLEDILNRHMPLHVVKKKIPCISEAGKLIKPEEPNGYKFELLVLDMIHMLDNCLGYEVIREHEFAPVKNKEGIDSVDTARTLLKKNGVAI